MDDLNLNKDELPKFKLPQGLLEQLFDHIIKNMKLDPKLIQDITVGNVIQPGAGIYTAKLAQAYANIPCQVPLSTCNRFCGSGLEACAQIAAKIKAGFSDNGLAAGVESMSIYDMSSVVDVGKLNEKCFST